MSDLFAPFYAAERPQQILREIDRLLAELHQELGEGREAHAVSSRFASAETSSLSRLASDLYRARRSREKWIDADLLGEPGWDILLDLFVQHEAGKRVSVSSVCVAAAVPATTALRWLDALAAHGWIERVDDGCDRRRKFVQLTDEGEQKMRGHLQEILMRPKRLTNGASLAS